MPARSEVSTATLTTTASGFRDGLGQRVFAIDRVGGEPRERLRVRPELAAFETALGLQIDRVSALTDPRFPRARDVDRDRSTGQVCVVSDYTAGERLSELLAAARARGVFPDIAAGLHTTNELLTAMAAFSRATKMAHGAIAPSRIVISDAGEIAITDYLYAPILTRLRFSPRRLWNELEIASGAGAPGFDEASDVRQIALVLMAMALGRPIQKHEYPAGAAALVSEVGEVAVISGGEAIAGPLRAWLERALNLQPRLLFGNVAHACASFGQILFDGGGVAASRTALVNFIEEVRNAPELAEPPVAPQIYIAPAAAAVAAIPVFVEQAVPPPIVELTPPLDVEVPAPIVAAPPIEAAPVLEEVTVVVDDRSVIAPGLGVEAVEAAPVFVAAAPVEAAPALEAPPIEEPPAAEQRPSKSGALSFFEEIVNAAKALAHRVERRAPVEPAPARREPARPEPIRPTPIEAAAPVEPPPVAIEPAPPPIERVYVAPAPPIEPVYVEPPLPIEPARVEAPPIEPVRSEPARFEPARFEPEPSEPEPFEPQPFEPQPFEPRPFEPARVQSPRFEPVPFEFPPAEPEPEPVAPAASLVDLTAAPASQPTAEPEIVEFGRQSFEPVPFELPPPLPAPEPVFEPIEPVRAAPIQPIFEPPYEPEPFPPAYAEPAVSSSEWDIEEPQEPVAAEPPPAPRLVPPPPPRPIAASPPPIAIEPEERDRKKKKKKKKDKHEPEAVPETLGPPVMQPVARQPDIVLPEIAPPGVIGLAPPQPQPGFSASGLAPSSTALPEIAPPGIVPLPPPLPPPFGPPPAAPPIATRPPIAPFAAPAPIRLKDTRPDILPRRERRDDFRQRSFSANVETAEHPNPYDAPRIAAARPRPAPGGYGAIIKIAAAVVVLAVVGFAAAKMGWSTSTSGSGVLTVESTPVGIDVYVDGTLKGKTPLTVPVAAGEHEVKLSRGRATHTVPVTIEAGKERVERVAWSKVRQGGAGGLQVTSQPPGAKVYVNGTLQGETPLELPNLAAGRYTVTVQGSSGSVKRAVRVTAGEQTDLDVELYSGFLRVIAPVELQLVENGRQLGSSGGDQVLLSPGRHEIVAINEPLGYREAHSVEIDAGETKTLTVQPTGTISINAVPWAEVWMEGSKLGETPIANKAVPIGTREVVFRHPEYGEHRVVTTVKYNQLTTVSADLTKP